MRARVRLRARARRVDAGRRGRARRRRHRRRADVPAEHRHVDRPRGQLGPRPAHALGGREGVLRAVLGRGLRRPDGCGRCRRTDRAHGHVLAALAGAGAHPRPSAAPPSGAVGADDQGPHLHADRCDGRRAHHVAARDARRRAQLGLPLHVDARHHVHPAGAALSEPGLGGRRVHAVRGRPRAEPGRRPADHVRHRRQARPDRVHPRRALRLRGRPAGADRQRRVRPASERRLRRGARLAPAAHASQPAPAPAAVAAGEVAGRRRRWRRGANPTRASGRPAGRRSTTCRRS